MTITKKLDDKLAVNGTQSRSLEQSVFIMATQLSNGFGLEVLLLSTWRESAISQSLTLMMTVLPRLPLPTFSLVTKRPSFEPVSNYW
jgi:hypothetical protein